MSSRQRFGRAIARIAILAWAVSIARDGSAATLYDFTWSDGDSLSAIGSLILGDSVGVGDPFDVGDVISFDLELFDGAVSQGTGAFPPFDPVFHALEGTRAASSLAIVDFYVSVPFGIRLGCDAEDCLSGGVFFLAMNVDFGSIAAARGSFVFTEIPEPGAVAAMLAAMVAILGLRAGRS